MLKPTFVRVGVHMCMHLQVVCVCIQACLMCVYTGYNADVFLSLHVGLSVYTNSLSDAL